jgi:hypothetical protein
MSMSNERMDRGSIGTVHALCEEAKPLMHMSFCPAKPIPVGFSGSFAPCSLPVLAGRHDDANVICLTRRTVNTSTGCLLPMYQRCKR